MRRSGFTLIELMIVSAVLGVIIMLVFGTVDGGISGRVDHEPWLQLAHQSAHGLRTAQVQRVITTGRARHRGGGDVAERREGPAQLPAELAVGAGDQNSRVGGIVLPGHCIGLCAS